MSDDRPIPPGLLPFWDGPLSNFASLPQPTIDLGMQERHYMYSLLLMSLIVKQWNGNKYGESGDYGVWRPNQELGTLPNGQKIYQGSRYLGHNIAALAVDGEGHIMDYDFNHNDVFDSTVEHAESRLVRRLFALNQVYVPWENEPQTAMADRTRKSRRARRPRQRRNLYATAVSDRRIPAANQETPPAPYSSLLKDVTIYTSLESCAQCSGIMCLASVKEIVYLQWDQGQFLIGNMMWQATNTEKLGFLAPLPIRGDAFDFPYFDMLNANNDKFSANVENNPFYRSPDGSFTDNRPSVTSFLCTDLAYQIYSQAQDELSNKQTCNYPAYQPPDTPTAITNAQVLTEIHDYLAWTDELNNRGTPHRV